MERPGEQIEKCMIVSKLCFKRVARQIRIREFICIKGVKDKDVE